MPQDVATFLAAKGYDASAAVVKYMAVKFTSDGVVGPVTGVSDNVCGITQESVTAGEITKGKGAPVMVDGITPFVAGATACPAGSPLSLGVLANGTLVPTGTGGAGTAVVGFCERAAAAGGRGSVRLT